jgi:hypothetical protein
MELTKEEEKILTGAYGKAYQKAMKVLVELGEFYDAKRLVPVKMAFLTIGPTPGNPGKGKEWLKELVDLGAKFKIPSFYPHERAENPFDHELNEKLGAIFAFQGGGNARNAFYTPVFGQHIVGDGTATTHYMNSYIGARANTECFIGQYSAAIIGKTPEYGFHLSENRKGRILFEIKTILKDETDWSALGYYISKKLGKNYWDVPVINGIKPDDVTNDELLSFSSSIPAYGAVVHSLLVGVSPESLTLEQAFDYKKPEQTFIVEAEEINEVYNTFSPEKEKPDMVSIGGFGVNVSIETVIKTVELLENKKVSKDFPTVILMDGPVRIVSDRMGLTDALRNAGVKIGMEEFLKDYGYDPSEITNIPIMSAKKLGFKTVVFADAKSCHYIGNQGVNSVLKHIEECIKIAVAGRMEV